VGRTRVLLAIGLVVACAPLLMSSAVASAAKTPVPACAWYQLQVLDSGALAALGNGAMAFDVVNTGARCQLKGYPSVEFLNAKGRAVFNRDSHTSSMLFAEPRESLVTLAPRATATFGVSFGDNPVNNESCPKVVKADVQLVSGIGRFLGEFPLDLSPCNGLEVTPIESGAWPRPNG
jgi:hypothetical protein